MSGRIITTGGAIAKFPTGATPERAALTDEDGFTCCCGTPDCCNTCSKAGSLVCNCRTLKPCCYNDGDVLKDGYWAFRNDVGPDFVIVEITQTTDGVMVGGNWNFDVTIRQRCRSNGVIKDHTETGVHITFLGGFQCNGLLPTNQRCRQWVCGPSGTYSIGNRDECCAFVVEFVCNFSCPFSPIKWQPDCNDYTDVFPENFDCFQDSRSGSWTEPLCSGEGVKTVSLYARVEPCAERCENNCTTCP